MTRTFFLTLLLCGALYSSDPLDDSSKPQATTSTIQTKEAILTNIMEGKNLIRRAQKGINQIKEYTSELEALIVEANKDPFDSNLDKTFHATIDQIKAFLKTFHYKGLSLFKGSLKTSLSNVGPIVEDSLRWDNSLKAGSDENYFISYDKSKKRFFLKHKNEYSTEFSPTVFGSYKIIGNKAQKVFFDNTPISFEVDNSFLKDSSEINAKIEFSGSSDYRLVRYQVGSKSFNTLDIMFPGLLKKFQETVNNGDLTSVENAITVSTMLGEFIDEVKKIQKTLKEKDLEFSRSCRQR